jgi:hypothetical protein
VYRELKRLSGGTLRQVGLLTRATASNSCRKNIERSKVSLASKRYRKVAERQDILSFFLSLSYFMSKTGQVIYQ